MRSLSFLVRDFFYAQVGKDCTNFRTFLPDFDSSKSKIYNCLKFSNVWGFRHQNG